MSKTWRAASTGAAQRNPLERGPFARDPRLSELDSIIARKGLDDDTPSVPIEEYERKKSCSPLTAQAPVAPPPPVRVAASPRKTVRMRSGEQVFQAGRIERLESQVKLLERRLDEQGLFLSAILERYTLGPLSECALGLSGERKPAGLESERERERRNA